MDMGFAPTWLRWVSLPLLHMTTLTTDYGVFTVNLSVSLTVHHTVLLYWNECTYLVITLYTFC